MWLYAAYMWVKGADLCTPVVRMQTRYTAVCCAVWSFKW